MKKWNPNQIRNPRSGSPLLGILAAFWLACAPGATTEEASPEQAPTEANRATASWSAAATILSVALSPDGSRVMTGAIDGEVQLWDARTGEALASLGSHEQGVSGVSFAAGGSRAVSWDLGSARVWGLSEGRELGSTALGEIGMAAAALSPDGKLLACASRDGEARLLKVEGGESIRDLPNLGPNPLAVRWLSEESVLCVDGGGRLRRFQDEDGEVDLGQLSFGAGAMAAMSEAGDRIVLGDGVSAQICVHRTEDGGQIHCFPEDDSPLYASSLAYSGDGRFVATGEVGGLVRIWSAETGRELWRHQLGSVIQAVSLSRQGKRLLLAEETGKIEIWEWSESSSS